MKESHMSTLTTRELRTLIGETVTSNAYQNSHSNKVVRRTLLCQGEQECSIEPEKTDIYNIELARESSSALSFFLNFNYKGLLLQVILYTLLTWFLGQAAITFSLRITTLLCSTRRQISCCQGLKILFHEVDVSFHPLSMTRRIFKDKMVQYDNKIEKLNNDNLKLHLIITGIHDANKLTNIRLDKISAKVDKLMTRIIKAPDTPPPAPTMRCTPSSALGTRNLRTC